MAKALVIVESPAKARTLSRILGDDFEVRASVGHVRDLPSRTIGVNLKKGFEPTYEIVPDRKKVVGELKSAAKKADALFLACDPDREGEAIAWHLSEILAGKGPVKRVTFHEITKAAVLRAFEAPGELDLDKINAQQARRILDRLVGYLLSPLLWQKVARGLSAGRVQSVAVRLIVEREREIAAFNAEEYWEVKAKLDPADAKAEQSFFTELKKIRGEPLQVDGKPNVLRNEEEATAVVASLQKAAWQVKEVRRKERKANPNPPFITSTLQQAASNRLRYSARRTMRVAQSLYEGIELGAEGPVGLITYMRTDSVTISKEAIAELRTYIKDSFGADYLPTKPNTYRSKKSAQEAHEAIRPTSALRSPDSIASSLNKDQLDLYRLIWERFVGSQMTPARAKVTSVDIEASAPADIPLPVLQGKSQQKKTASDPESDAEGPGVALFRASGRVPVFDGYTRVMTFTRRSDRTDANATPVLPDLSEEQALELIQLTESQHHTSPPPRYTEASLVKSLEELGIGRPSTYASIIATIQDRDYVEQQGRRFHATELGEVVTDKLLVHFPDIMGYDFTSHMENELDQVEAAKADYRSVLKEFYGAFNNNLKVATREMKSLNENPEPSDRVCEKCEKPLVYKRNKRDLSRFLSCTGYPNCRFTLPVNREGAPLLPEETDISCDECGNRMMKRYGRRGAFLSCSAWPRCESSRDLPPEEGGTKDGTSDIAEIKLSCELCLKAMVMRRGKRGPFVACSGYPECRNTLSLAKLRRVAEASEKKDTAEAETQTEDGDGQGSEPPASSDAADEERRIIASRTPSGRLRILESRPPDPAAAGQLGQSILADGTGEAAGDDADADADAAAEPCKKCGKPMALRTGRRGRFLGCTGYPTCKGTRRLQGKATQKKAEPAGIDCSRCGKPMLKRSGPRGDFAGCSGYPKCRNSQPLGEDSETPS